MMTSRPCNAKYGRAYTVAWIKGHVVGEGAAVFLGPADQRSVDRLPRSVLCLCTMLCLHICYCPYLLVCKFVKR